MDAGVLHLVAHRLPWLMIMMLSATLSSTIINHFESVLAGAVVLTAFIPMLTGSAGNSGSQTSVTIIRNMSLGEVELSDWFAVLWKELRVAVVSGGALAVVNFIRMMIFDQPGVMICAVVSVTLLCAIVLAATVGCLLPMGAKKLGLDPAVMASPMITTLVDAGSLAIMFGLASRFLLG
jgi:magnesium transporter